MQEPLVDDTERPSRCSHLIWKEKRTWKSPNYYSNSFLFMISFCKYLCMLLLQNVFKPIPNSSAFTNLCENSYLIPNCFVLPCKAKYWSVKYLWICGNRFTISFSYEVSESRILQVISVLLSSDVFGVVSRMRTIQWIDLMFTGMTTFFKHHQFFSFQGVLGTTSIWSQN